MNPLTQFLWKRFFPFLLLLLPIGVMANEYQELLEESYLEDGPGAAAIVVKDGETMFASATGLANLELKVNLSENSVFQIASLTKQITAAAIRMALKAAGIVNPLVKNRSAVSNSELADIVGIYQIDGDDTKSTISLVGDKVFSQDDGDDTPWEMIPFARDSFFFPGYFQVMKFVRDHTGKVTGMNIHPNGNNSSIFANRIDDNSPINK